MVESSGRISYSENKFCMGCVKFCPTDAISFDSAWEPEGARDAAGKFVGSSSDRPATQGKTPTRPTKIVFNRCVGCGACENSCNQIVMGEPAMVTTSFGRATLTRL